MLHGRRNEQTRRQSTTAGTAAVSVTLAALFAGCGPETTPAQENTGGVSSAVELSGRGSVYDLAFQPTPLANVISAIAGIFGIEQNYPIHATGAIQVNENVVSGGVATGPLNAPDGTRIRATCGVTFISPSFAIAAGHCLSSPDLLADPVNDRFTIEMYRPTVALINNWQKVSNVTGTWPAFTHPQLTTADGYVTDRFNCQLIERCGNTDNFNCDPAVHAQMPDISLSRCDGRPGDRYGYLNVATDVNGAEIFNSWKHEVVNVPASAASGDNGLFDHYVASEPDQNQNNFHYFGDNRNQLLPLHSALWPDGSSHHTFGDQGIINPSTDLLGCHGTSGSGVLQRNPAHGTWEFMGAMVDAGGIVDLQHHLCAHVPPLTGGPAPGPGTEGLTYTNLFYAQYLYDRHRTDIENDCAHPSTGGFFGTLIHVISQAVCRQIVASTDFGQRTVPTGVDGWRDNVVLVGGGNESPPVSFSGFTDLQPGKSYRVTLTGMARSGCSCGTPEPTVTVAALGAETASSSVCSCPSLTVALNGQTVLTRTFDTASAPQSLATIVTAPQAQNGVMTFRASGADFEVGDVSVVADGAVNTFDLQNHRLEGALFGQVAGTPVGPIPMRYEGDGRSGFLAVLNGGERMVLGRAALPAGHAYFLRFKTSDASRLSCGIVNLAGVKVATLPSCDARAVLRIPPPATAGDNAGLFIEASGSATTPVTIDDVQIASDAGPDTDGDGIPDPIDNCPTTPNANQADGSGTGVGDACLLAGLALYGTRSMTIADRVHVVDGGGFGRIAAGGSAGTTTTGTDTEVGDIFSVGSVSLHDRTHVHGIVRTGGTVTPGSDVVIDGGTDPNASIALPSLASFLVTSPPPTGGNVMLEPNQTRSLAPGSYGQVVVKSGATLNVRAGTYFFASFDLEPQGNLVLTQASGLTEIHVDNSVIFRGVERANAAVFPGLRTIFNGQSDTKLEARYRGVFIAPRARLTLGTIAAGFTGRFYAQDAAVEPGTTVTRE